VPAAAVIPAPKAYINVAAVKTLVVGFVHGLGGLSAGLAPPPVYMQNASVRLTVWCCCFHAYFEQTMCSMQVLAVNTEAWGITNICVNTCVGANHSCKQRE